MKALPTVFAAAGLVLVGLAASNAQPANPPGQGPGSRGAAAWGSDVTPGWALMTEQERKEHRDRMRGMTNFEECKTFHAQHHEQMQSRAKEMGKKMPAMPRRDACEGLKR